MLDRVTLLVVPIYNVDGHERVSRFNRSNQDGPEDGMGFRTNARGLDLNRDHLKLDSAEARALVALVNAWRPQLHVDNHVSDGFDHAWVIGYATAEAPQAAPSVDAWAKPTCRRSRRPRGAPASRTGPYLELLSSDDPLKGAITPPYRPRYSTGYFALRNRPSILIETHSHKPFRTRVLGNQAWLEALLEQVASAPGSLVEAVAAAESRTLALGAATAPASDVALRYGPDRDDPAAGGGAPDRVRLPLFAFSRSTSLVTGTPLTTYRRGELLESDLPWYHTPRVTQSVPRPRGYVVLPGWPRIEQCLRAHGLRFPRRASGRRARQAQRLDPRRGRGREQHRPEDAAGRAGPGEVARQQARGRDGRARVAGADLRLETRDVARPVLGVAVHQEVHRQDVAARGEVAAAEDPHDRRVGGRQGGRHREPAAPSDRRRAAGPPRRPTPAAADRRRCDSRARRCPRRSRAAAARASRSRDSRRRGSA